MKKFLLFLLATLMIISVCSCGKKNSNDKSSNNEEIKPAVTDNVNSEAADSTEEDVSNKFYESDADVYGIDTPYGVIYYPLIWSDTVSTEVTETNTAYSIKFFAQLDGKSVPLYSVVFGTYDGDNCISSGSLSVDNKNVRVYFVDHSAEGMEAGLTGEHETTYLTMCEAINDIISNLIYKNGMELD